MRAVGAMTYQFFHQRKASILEQLEKTVGPLAEAYAIKVLREGRPAGYGVDIAVERIKFLLEGYP